MENSIKRAIANIVEHGDTDIFPYPIENRIIKDCPNKVLGLALEIDSDFENFLVKIPPANHGALAPAGYTGFRWATQIDPIWNVYFLALVIKIGKKIEDTRLGIDTETVFSYRFVEDNNSSGLFDKKSNWRAFVSHAIKLADQYKYVIACDISEFYPRLNHHRLDNALQHVGDGGDVGKKIMSLLGNFSGTYSFGLPVGGACSKDSVRTDPQSDRSFVVHLWH